MFFRRDKKPPTEVPSAVEPEPAAPQVFEGEQPCTERGCDAQNGVPCSYTDRTGAACPTSWCPGHQAVVSGRPYCRRHAGIARALEALPERDRVGPDLGNRAPSLVVWMANALDADMRALLVRRLPEYPDGIIGSGPLSLQLHGTPRVRTWAYRWALSDHRGLHLRIVASVDEQSDSTLTISVQARPVARAVPPWITERILAPDDDAARRLAFNHGLLAAAARGLLELAPPGG
ncbi:MAG: hypothetical protein ABR573_11730 [Candidatus Dormibacteria bacterium]